MIEAINDRTRLVYVCNPNDPTGTFAGRDELRKFVEAVPEDVGILIDEGSADYVMSPDFPSTIADASFHRSNLVTLRTFSRAYGLAGLRVGYLAGSPEIVSAVQKVQSNYEVTNVAQAAAVASLRDKDEMDRRASLNQRDLRDLQHGFRQLGLQFWPSYSNIVFIKMTSPRTFARKLLFEGVLAEPFEGPGPTLSGVRITVGTPDQVGRTITALANILADAVTTN